MSTDSVFSLIEQGNHALLVFLNVLLQQLGLPVPAVPTMVAAGGLASGHGARALLLALAVVASVAADLAWYVAGKRFGYRVLSGLCRMSINPGSCVAQTEARFLRWGIWSLVVAKFVPGFSTVAPPIAGALRMPLSRFVPAALGGGLWAGAALLAGWLFRDTVAHLLGWLALHGVHALIVFATILCGWIGWKLWRKRRFEREAEIPHISIGELAQVLEAGRPLRLIDLRGALMRGEAGVIPGAIVAEADGIAALAGGWPRDAAIVTLCACPADAAAIKAARALVRMGFTDARPLRGGWDAWRERFGGAGAGQSSQA